MIIDHADDALTIRRRQRVDYENEDHDGGFGDGDEHKVMTTMTMIRSCALTMRGTSVGSKTKSPHSPSTSG